MQVEIIRTDGRKEKHTVAQFSDIARLIAAAGTDTVNLGKGRVMVVDDYGYETHMKSRRGMHPTLGAVTVHEMVCDKALKPVNLEATKLYHSVCRPGTTHQIVGDVAILQDDELAEEAA